MENIYTTLADLPPIPEAVHDHLPSVLSEQLGQYDLQEEKDVFIAGGLGVLSGCLVNVQGQYANGEYHHPHLYIFIVAPPGGGKGSLNDAARLARPIHRKLKQRSKAKQAEWREKQKEDGDEFDGAAKPPLHHFIVPGNTSTSALIQVLDDNDGQALMIETEADTLSQTMEKEWGNFSDILRKAHPHEPISSGRIDEVREVENPRLSLVLSGTPDQLPRLADEVGNGLWSRLCPFGFIPTSGWKDVSPRYTDEDQTISLDAKKQPGEEVLELYEVLANRSKPLEIRLLETHWEQINEIGRKAKDEVHQNLGFAGDGVTHRMGIHIFRIASILGVWSAWDQSEGLADEDHSQLVVDDGSFKAALTLGQLFARHNINLLDAMSGSDLGGEVNKLEQKWLKQLPVEFQTAEAVSMAKDLQIAERTAKRRLRQWTEEGVLEKLQRGHYRKTEEYR
jgi:hypothetical protein